MDKSKVVIELDYLKKVIGGIKDVSDRLNEEALKRSKLEKRVVDLENRPNSSNKANFKPLVGNEVNLQAVKQNQILHEIAKLLDKL